MPDAQPSMIVLARESRGFSQSDLARRLSASSALLSRVENGVRTPTPDFMQRLADTLDYPLAFFEQTDPIVGFGTSELFHRKRQDLSNRKLDAIHAQINIRRMHMTRLLRNVEIGNVNVPSLDVEDFDGKVQDIARAVRAWWHIRRGPIQSVTKVIEDARGVIILFDFATSRIDAISQWPPGLPPLFFVDVNRPADRIRLTLCHELAHMVMHQQAPNPDMEEQAYRFAAEFLMPEKEVRPYLNDLSLPKLASLKSYWKVSMAALLKRASDLGEITPRHAKTLWSQIGRAGYRLREPAELDLPPEPPSLFKEIIDAHRNEMSYGPAEFAAMVKLSEQETQRAYFDPPSHLRLVNA